MGRALAVRSALSGAGAESPAAQAPAPRSPAQLRNRKVHASCFNFSAPRRERSESRDIRLRARPESGGRSSVSFLLGWAIDFPEPRRKLTLES